MWHGKKLMLSIAFVTAILTNWLESTMLRKWFPSLYVKSLYWSDVPQAYALVILSNLVLSSLTISYLSFKVNKAREKFKALAKKEGSDTDEQMFSPPNLYAPGNSENARKFNAIQRGHQHALETFPQFVILSLVGGIIAPVATACSGILYCLGKLVYAKVYEVDLNPCACCNKPICYGIFYAYVAVLVSTLQVCFLLLNFTQEHKLFGYIPMLFFDSKTNQKVTETTKTII